MQPLDQFFHRFSTLPSSLTVILCPAAAVESGGVDDLAGEVEHLVGADEQGLLPAGLFRMKTWETTPSWRSSTVRSL